MPWRPDPRRGRAGGRARTTRAVRCPLCAGGTHPFAVVEREGYHRCRTCALVFLDPAHRLDRAAERARYELHENDPSDDRYRAFLERLAAPLAERLPAGARGLDYGSGPGPTLSRMMEERGFPVACWDPFFAPDRDVLEGRYDFVTCSETAEHFFEPGAELRRLDGLLRPGGWLGLMTRVLEPGLDFERWWYARDPTHVCFYAPDTLAWIARWRGWSLERVGEDVALFRKESGKDPRAAGGMATDGDPEPERGS